MKTQCSWLGRALFGASLAMFAASPAAWADGDSSSDVDGGFHNTVAASEAVMIRVPVNARGEENTNAAQMRVITGASSTAAPTDYQATFNRGIDVSHQPTVDTSTSRDSSTNWYGWNNWYGYGWNYNYYYNYRPYYSYYNYGYSNPYYYYYGSPYYYSYNYGYYPYYRYYWYARTW